MTEIRRERGNRLLVPASATQIARYLQRQTFAAEDPFVEAFTFVTDYPITAKLLSEAFVRAVCETITLRAVFLESNGELLQEFPAFQEERAVRHESVSHLPNSERSRAAEDLCDEFFRSPLDLSLGPLIQLLLIDFGAGQLKCAVRVSRMVMDRVILEELWIRLIKSYDEVLSGRPRKDREIDLGYVSAEIRREVARNAKYDAEARRFWAGYLPRERVPMSLPTRTTAGSLRYSDRRGDHAPVQVSPEIADAVRELAESLGCPTSDIYQAVLVGLLARYSDVPNLVVNEYHISNASASLISPTTRRRTIPLVLTASEPTPFREIVDELGKVRQRVIDGSHGIPPEPTQSSRSESGADYVDLLNQVGFRYIRYRPPIDQHALKIRDLGTYRHFRPESDLILSVGDYGSFALVGFHYCLDLFDPRVIDDLCRHYSELLTSFVRNPNTPIGLPRMLSDEEEHRLVAQWNDTDADYSGSRGLSDLIHETARRFPKNAAVADSNEMLTYAQLIQRADGLAQLLAEAGVGHHDHVALLQERSVDVVVAMVACISVGATYVPLEPDDPAARISSLCAQVDAKAMICDSQLRDKAPEGIPSVSDLSQTSHAPSVRMGSLPNDVAYVLFTSGSTGLPKAAQVTNRGVVNLVQWIIRTFGLDEHDVVVFKTPYSHDISVPELFVPLLTGGRIEVADPGGHRDPQYLRALITRSGATVIHFVPTMLAEFTRDLNPTDAPSLRYVFAGGEALPLELAQRISTTFPWKLINVYGPTECTDYATYWPVVADDAAVSPIGRPIANTRCYVLSKSLSLKPVGVAGELCLSGDGVGLGYLGLPERTAEAFVPNPYEPGRVMYRTGDICRWRPDGNLEFIRRDDGQVKVRGHRIELGEVESRLTEHPDVEACVVTLRESDGIRQLIAYVQIPNPGLIDGLRTWCKDALPEYMVPAVFVPVSSFTRTGSGKIDRKVLPEPQEDPVQASSSTEPESATQRRLQGIWRELLGRRSIPIDHNLADLGMDSIHAIRCTAQLLEQGYQLTVADVFDNPTIRDLARWLDTQTPMSEAPAADTSNRDEVRAFSEKIPLTPSQEAMVAASLSAPGSGMYVEQILFSVRTSDAARTVDAFQKFLSSHPLMSLSVALDGNGFSFDRVPVTAPEPEFVRVGSSKEFGELLASDRSRGFAVPGHSLWRLTAIELESDQTCIVWTHHHVLLDGWSLSQIQASLIAAAAGRASKVSDSILDDLARFVAESQRWNERRGDDAVGFWGQYLDGAEPNELLTVHSGKPGHGEDLSDLDSVQPITLGMAYESAARAGVRVNRVTNTVAKSAVSSLSYRANVTIATTLRAVWARVYAHYVNRDDVLIGMASSGRSLPNVDSSQLLGCTLVTIPTRVKLDRDQSVVQWLKACQESSLRTMEWERLPLAKITEQALGASGGDLLRHLFVFEGTYGVTTDSEVPVRRIGSIDQTEFPLIVQVDASGDDIDIHFSYDPGVYSRRQIDAVAYRYRLVLDQMIRSPETGLGSIELTTDEERRYLSVDQTIETDIGTESLAQLIAQAANTHSERPAIFFRGKTYSYGELESTTSTVTSVLRDAGVRAGQPVALMMGRDPRVIATILAVWRIGAHYVPVDPQLPGAVRADIITDIGATVVVCDFERKTDVPAESATVRVVSLPSLEALFDEQSTSDTPSRAGGWEDRSRLDDVAYVLYTSGSTGKPKGVVQTHRTLVNMWRWFVDELDVGTDDTMVYKTPYTFDVSLPDMFFLLGVGGTIAVADDGMQSDPDYLADLVNASNATIIQFVPSMLDVFVASGALARTTSLRWVLAAGERLTQAQALAFFEASGELGDSSPSLRNLYGPTETFYITDGVVGPEDVRNGDPTIGRVFPNNTGYVVDSLGAMCGVGVAGELVIRGNQVAVEYHHRPELTERSFIDHPFPGRLGGAGGRAYRTGDIVSWDGDWRLRYLGRRDEQVKVNGVRIELGAVTSVLLGHPDVDRAIASVLGSPGRLVAFVHVKQEDSTSAESLRVFCSQRLPTQAVPSQFVFVTDFPMTRHGKADLRRLQELAEREVTTITDDLAIEPSTPTEEAIAAVLADVRPDLAAPSVDRAIFENGYTSLDGIRMVVQLRAQGFQVDIATCYTLATIAAIARHVDASTGSTISETQTPAASEANGLPWSQRLARAIDAFDSVRLASSHDRGDKARGLDTDATLVTGATGFLGRHLVAHLLSSGSPVIATGRDISSRIAAAIKLADPNADAAAIRLGKQLRTLELDLDVSGLGLSGRDREQLHEFTGRILHAGAHVHHLYPYDQLEQPNILATAELLALAGGAESGAFHFISTVATILGASDSDAPPALGGYVESKWVAERVVEVAHNRGLHADVIRPPRLYASPKSGVFNDRDALVRLLRGCVTVGAAPEDIASEPLLCIDDAVELIDQWDSVPHSGWGNQLPWIDINIQDIFSAVVEWGVGLRRLPNEEWLSLILAEPNNAATPVLSDFGLGPGESVVRIDYSAIAPAVSTAQRDTFQGNIFRATELMLGHWSQAQSS